MKRFLVLLLAVLSVACSDSEPKPTQAELIQEVDALLGYPIEIVRFTDQWGFVGVLENFSPKQLKVRVKAIFPKHKCPENFWEDAIARKAPILTAKNGEEAILIDCVVEGIFALAAHTPNAAVKDQIHLARKVSFLEMGAKGVASVNAMGQWSIILVDDPTLYYQMTSDFGMTDGSY